MAQKHVYLFEYMHTCMLACMHTLTHMHMHKFGPETSLRKPLLERMAIEQHNLERMHAAPPVNLPRLTSGRRHNEVAAQRAPPRCKVSPPARSPLATSLAFPRGFNMCAYVSCREALSGWHPWTSIANDCPTCASGALCCRSGPPHD